MRFVIIILISIFSIISIAFGDLGYITDYDVEGTSIGQTELLGNLKVSMKPQAKRVTAEIFYQEAGNPFPNLDEKDIFVDFKNKKKPIRLIPLGFRSVLTEV